MPSKSILVGLVGAGIQASLTPRLHEKEGDAQGMRYMYKLIDLDVLGIRVTALSEILTAAERLGFAGLNVTYPCKQAVIEELDELSPDARAIGAVNTVIFRNGRRLGHNTDWTGFSESFRRTLADVGRNCVVQFGAGGAGAAVAYALLTLGVRHVVLIDTDRKRARDLAKALLRAVRGRPGGHPQRSGRGVGCGRRPRQHDVGRDGEISGNGIPSELLSPRLWVAEIIYFPLETELLRMARECGCRTMSGAGMAVFQAVEAFRLFSGAEPDAQRMLAHFAQLTGAP